MATTHHSTSWQHITPHLRRLRRHGSWMLLALGLVLLCRHAIPQQALQAATEVGGNFLQTFGGMYGVIVAFAIYVTWGQHVDTQVAIEREAVSLLELYRVLGWFSTWPQRDEVRAQLHGYALAVPKAHRGDAGVPADQGHVLDQALAAFLRHGPGAPVEERLHALALELFHELNEARQRRITVSGLHLPTGLRGFVYLGGAATIGALCVVWVDSLVMHSIFVVGMTWVVVAAATIVIDLDDPYSGDFVVDWDRFEQIAQAMNAVPYPAPSAPTR